jgi:hypothetical protein
VVLHKRNISISGSIEDLTSWLFLIDAFLRSDSAAAGGACIVLKRRQRLFRMCT